MTTKYRVNGGKRSIVDFFIYFIGITAIEFFVMGVFPGILDWFADNERVYGHANYSFFYILFGLPMVIFYFSRIGSLELKNDSLSFFAYMRGRYTIKKQDIKDIEIRVLVDGDKKEYSRYVNIMTQKGVRYSFHVMHKYEGVLVEKELQNLGFKYRVV